MYTVSGSDSYGLDADNNGSGCRALTEKLLKLVDIAQLLGVTKQRAHQLSKRRRFPAPAASYGRGLLWRQSDVQRWAGDYRGGAARWGARS